MKILPELGSGRGTAAVGGGGGANPRCAGRPLHHATHGPPPRDKLGEDFAASATRLAGLAGALLGWRPHEFWRATPAELAAVLDALTPPQAAPVDLAHLQEMFPDGR